MSRFDDALTDVSMGQFTATMAYDNLKKTDVYNSSVKTQRKVLPWSLSHCSTSACKLDSLTVEVCEPQSLSSNFVCLALVGDCFLPFFGAHFVKSPQTIFLGYDPWSFGVKDLARSTLYGLVSPDFSLFAFFKDANGQGVFLRFSWTFKRQFTKNES